MKWKTQTGKEIEVEDMDDNHALNTVNMLMRNSTPQIILECILVGRKKLLDDIKSKNTFVKYTIELNGDMAQEFNDTNYGDEQEYFDLQDTSWYKEGF